MVPFRKNPFLRCDNISNVQLLKTYWRSVYEGEDDGQGNDQNDGNQDKGQGQGQGKGKGQGQDKEKEKLLTQEEFNKALAEDRKKHQEQTKKLIQDLENLKKSNNLTTEEKKKLTTQIEELNQQVMSKEQLLEKEKTRLQGEHQTELKTVRAESEMWRNRFTEATIIRTITDSAVQAEAFSPEQIVSLLETKTRLVEDTDTEGKGLGTFTPRVKFNDIDNEGKPTILDITVPEALKLMKDKTEKYGNLFKSNVNSGIGGSGSVGVPRIADPRKIRNMDDFRKMKPKLLERK